jgi:hypothetical protein
MFVAVSSIVMPKLLFANDNGGEVGPEHEKPFKNHYSS